MYSFPCAVSMSTFRTTFQNLDRFGVRDTLSVSPSESVVGLGQEIKDGWSSSGSALTAEAWKAWPGCRVVVCHWARSSTCWADRKPFCVAPQRAPPA